MSGSWEELAILTASDGGAEALFGDSVAIDGDVVAVGAPQVNQVYLFTKPPTGWGAP
ncbi:MAG TPA: hypothetical protein EYP34_14645 [Chromatiaceae bacterium]|nr:hypothetical protein [Chromatiaceae bacterium]